jgi:protein N-terminal methyltransferase
MYKADVRSNAKWHQVFAEAGLEVVKEEIQEGLPQELFTVKT